MKRGCTDSQTVGILLGGTHPWTNAPFDWLLPRTLLPVAHRALIWYGLSWLDREGIRETAVCGNRESRLLEARLARHVPRGMSVTYREDAIPRGAAGSVRDAAWATEAQTFVVADGTAIQNVDLRDLLGKHQTSGACLTVVVHREARRYGSQALAVPQGIYIFDRRALDGVPAHGFCDIKEKLIPQLHSAGERVVAYETPMVTPRVLDSSTYMAVNEWMIEHLVRRGEQCEDYRRSGNASGLAHAFCPERSSKVRPRSGAAQPFARVPWSRAPRCGDGPRSARTPSPIDVSWLTTRSSSPVHTQCGRS